MRKNIKNISTTLSKDAYYDAVDIIARKYPNYSIIVDGGSWRGYNVRYEVNHSEKVIKLDYYLPLYTDFNICNSWVLTEIAKGNTSGSLGFGFLRAIKAAMGVD